MANWTALSLRRLLLLLLLLLLLIANGQTLHISWITPNRGSISGGTDVKIYGSGFATDAYSSTNLVYIGNIPCEVNWYTATAYSMECMTTPYPNAQEGNFSSWLRFQLISGGVYHSSNYQYRYDWNYTPQVRAVVPSSGPVGSIIEIGGYRFQSSLSSYERLFLGGSTCDPRAPGTDVQYGTRWSWPLRYVKCIATEQQVGGWNASAILTTGYKGTSWNHSEALYPMHDWKLAMYELFPDIHSVLPQSGSDQGGTLLTIQGTGFGINADDVSVDVDGIPCQIVSHNTSQLRCWTGKPHPGSPAIASSGNTYPITDQGYRFKGSRGVRFSKWRNIGGGQLSNLHTSSRYPDDPDRYGIRPSFSTQDNSNGNNYGERLMAFFNPHSSGRHTFFVSSDDEGGLWMTQGNNITKTERIAHNPHASGWNNFARFSEQRSVVFNLTEEEDYLLVGEFKEGGGGDYMQVGVLMHEEKSFTYSQTQKVNRERQLLQLTTEGLYDVQVLQVAMNKSELDRENIPEFFIDWGGRTSEVLQVLVLETDSNILNDTILSLFHGVCDFGTELGVHHYGNSVFDFEGGVGSDETWRAWNVKAPEIVEDESYCGRHSLYVEESRALAFSLNPEDYNGFRTSDYPFLCMAYKLPPNHPMGIAIHIRDVGWRTIQVSSTGQFSFIVIASFADYTAETVYDDDRWHYQCVDLQTLLQQELMTSLEDSNSIPEHRILGFGFYSGPDEERRGFHVDEISFSSENREVRFNAEKYQSPARPNGISLHDIIKTRQVHSVDDSNTFNLTIALEIIPASCDYNIPLINITLLNESAPGLLEFSFYRTQSASVPLGGSYTLSYGGANTTAIQHDAEEEEIEEALESLPGAGEVSAWYHSDPLPQDRLGKFCPGRRVFIRFETTSGDLPLLGVETDNLTGDGLDVSVSEQVTGGLFLRPIPGHMLQTVETQPQVHVRVRGQLAACSGGKSLYAELEASNYQNTCGFTYTPTVTPTVSYISPTSATTGDIIQINGSGFSANVTENFIRFGGIDCNITSSSAVLIECTLGVGVAGNHALHLQVLSYGVAETDGIELHYPVGVDSISVTEGSEAGGTDIVIMGSGFVPQSVPQSDSSGFIPDNVALALDYANTFTEDSCFSGQSNIVLIGDNECTVSDSTYTTISCTTPENTGPETTHNVTVIVLCNDDPADTSHMDTLPNAYTYSAAITPVITSVAPGQGSGVGGETITISGSRFSGTMDENHVELGGAECSVTSSTSTQITCVTPPHGHGSVDVIVRVEGRGKASSNVSFVFVTEVSHLSHCSGSIFGGQVLGIDGMGFGTNPLLVDVNLGDHPCQLVSINGTRVICVTGSTARTHQVNNNDYHDEYGLGYRWSPENLTINVGDTVKWSWTGSSFTTRRSVMQVEQPGDTEYNGYGFRSERRVTGTFRHSFTTPGTYYYIAEGYGHIGFGGSITVQDMDTQTVPLHITINSIPIDLQGLAITCGDAPSPFTQYSFSVSDTPVIQSITSPASTSRGDDIIICLQLISIQREDNVFTIGGVPCAGTSPQTVSTTLSEPDLLSPHTMGMYNGGEISCTVPSLEPGHYRTVLHVAGKGWAHASLDSTTLDIKGIVRSTPQYPTGSLRGGIEVSISTRGLLNSNVLNSRVTIGNTPCLIQTIKANGDLTCTTQPAVDDGYSSLVYNDEALAYWSLQADYFELNGTYISSDGDLLYRSGGTMGQAADATVFGGVMSGQAGISGNSLTDQCALFNASYIEAPALGEFSHPAGFGVGLWMKTPSSGHHYRVVTSSASFDNGVSSGYLLLLNPCNELEFWVATGEGLSEVSFSNSCQVITDQSECSQPCAGPITVPESATPGALPAGVWHVIRNIQSDWSDWHFISFGWEADDFALLVRSWSADSVDCTADDLCSGTQMLHVDSTLVNSTATTYLPSFNSPIQMGGTSELPLGMTTASNSSQLAPFAGHLDEVSFYGRPLSDTQVETHHFYGSSEKQPIWIVTDAVDGIGMGVVPNVRYPERNPGFEEETIVDWDMVQQSTYTVGNATAIRFQWNGLHGVRQVSRSVYKSCDLEGLYIRQWAPNQRAGDVTVWVEPGGVYYFIDSVVGGCLDGTKMKVQVGEIEVIEWRLGRMYTDLTISEGTGLLFQWDGSVGHDVIEMASPLSTTRDCEFVNQYSKKLGQVVREWYEIATTSGEVAIIGLSVGQHHFVCSVPGHCQAGMRFTVTVIPGNVEEEEEEEEEEVLPMVHTIPWRIQRYETLNITRGETVQFVWAGFHSLHQVTGEVFDACDLSVPPLYEWGEPSVDNSASISSLTPGTYYFICAVSGHCDAGMKIQVNVLPDDGLPVISDPLVAGCTDMVTGHCSFTYSTAATPELLRVEPDHSHAGTTLRVYGRGLLTSNTVTGTQIESVVVWLDKAPCINVTAINASAMEDIVECTITNYESRFYHVDVFVEGKGFASVTSTPLAPGPHRNGTHPLSNLSPYPIFFLAATVTAITPNHGSLAGGTHLQITGSGFSLVSEQVSVTLGNIPCQITSLSLSEINCITGPSLAASQQEAALNIRVNSYPASTTLHYTYTSMATPTITAVSGGSNLIGGNEIQIFGQNFVNDSSLLQVQIASPGSTFDFSTPDPESLCNITSSSETSISCTVPSLVAGSYQVLVQVRGLGLAKSQDNVVRVTYTLLIEDYSPTSSGNGGGIELTISGNGFPTVSTGSNTAAGIIIRVCQATCTVTESSVSELKCILGANQVSPPFSTSTSCNISAAYQNIEADSTSPFQFIGMLTPRLDSISPTIGGTAGGTIATITGSGFLPPEVTDANSLDEEDILITVDGSVCEWFDQGTTITSATIVCRTSEHVTTLQAKVKVFVRGKGYALNGDAPVLYEYIDRWSSVYTWGEGPLPQPGDSVYIKQGQTVFLDICPPILNLILIEGALIFEDKQDLHLQAKYIFINHGKLQVGTETSPFQHNARITLHGSITDPEIPIYGAKVLGIRQGELDLHGRPRNITWVRLAETVNATDTRLQVQQPVDWVSGDRIVIAPTGKDGNETEEAVIESVSDDGFWISLVDPLIHTHHGVTEVFENGQFIEMRAEVGLLSHNVIVEGTRLETPTGFEGLGADKYGMQIFVHRMGPHPTPIRIEHTEVRNAGQAFRLGRYAIHFHLSGSMNGSYVKHCAIHHSFNRAITAHGVHHLLIEGNVAYDIMGHTFFVEDGIETHNRYLGNLGVLTRGSSSLLNTDQIPATFWITNPLNTFVGNAAAASRGYGFWYDLDNHPSGASSTRTICPNKMPFGEFRDNTAHTCNEFGLRIWETYQPHADACGFSQPSTATLYNFTSYANGIHGLELSVIGHVRIVGFKVADNAQNGIEIQETIGSWGGPMIQDALVVSHTSINTGEPQLGGIKTPNTPKLTISNVTFVNFDFRSTSCLKACSHCKVRQGGFQVWFERLSFLGGSESRKTFFQWEHEVLYRDLDGSLTGHVGGWATPDNSLHPPQHCTKSVPEFSLNPSFPGTVCTSDVYFLRMAWNQATPLATLRDQGVNVTNEFGSSLVPWRHYRLTHLDGYMCTMPSGYEHSLVWTLPPQHRVDTTFYNAGVYGLLPDNRLWITHEFVMLPNHVNVGGNYEPTDHGGPPSQDDPHLSWHIDNKTNLVTYLVSGVNRTGYNDVSLQYRYEPCPRDGCPPPGIDFGPYESFQRRWSDPASWPSGALPEEGEEVTISSRWRMLVDMTPPPLGYVIVFGELMFEDQRDYNFTANLILIQGPNARLIIGTENSPFTHNVILTLTGRRNDVDLPLTRTLNLGSKAIGVFGNLSIHGMPRTRTWTRLAASALVGEDEIVLQGNDYPNWQVGEEIVIAPSGWDPAEAEIRTIASYDGNSGTITLDTPLQFDHIVHNFLDSSDLGPTPQSNHWWGDGGALAPEVGLLTHNIVIQGGDDPDEPLEFHHYGCRLLAGSYPTTWFTFTGHLKLDSVEFRYCGQGGYFSPRDPRYSIAFRDSTDTSNGSYIRRCSIHHGYNTAIGIHTSNGIEVSENVIWRTTDSSVKVGGRGNRVRDNLAMMTTTIQPNVPRDNHAVDFPATYDVDGGNIVRGNAAAGSTRIAFRYSGEPCLENNQPLVNQEADFWDNTAHSGLIGLNILGLPTACTSIGGFTSMFQWNYALFSSTASSLVATHLRIASGKVGLNLNIFGPSPVEHLLGRKFITVADSLIVGSLPGESCDTRAPDYRVRGSVSFTANDHKLGIMMSSFNQRRSKMDGTGAWHLMKGYPVIDGVLNVVDITFARFFDLRCNYGVFAIGNNPISPDAVHPMEMRGTVKYNVELPSLAFFYEPDVEWIVQEDCVDMDCDGPKHALIRDIDGQFVGSSPAQGSIVPFAELRFGNYSNRLPVTWLANTEFGETAMVDQVVEHRGIARGDEGNLDSPSGGCVFIPQWQAYRCKGLQHHMFVIESMDADTETRRLSPLALDGGDTGNGDYTDLLNGPMDHGWCTYYTCLKRLSTFFSLVAVGTDYCVWMTGSSPSHLRFHLLNAGQNDAIKLCVWFKTTQRKDVYKNGIYIEPTNVVYIDGGGIEQLDNVQHIPSRNMFSGANYFDRESQILHVIIKGSDPIEIKTPPVVQVSFNLAVSIDDFFNVGELIHNLAFALRIDPSRIRVVNIIAEDQPGRRRRSLLAVDNFNHTTITLEFGNPPPLNISTPEPPSIAQEIAMARETNDSVDLQGNELPETPDASANPLNEDPPSSVEEFVRDYNLTVERYIENVNAYQEAVAEVEEVNELGERCVNLILINASVIIENATVTGLTAIPATAPPFTSPPSIPPAFENATIDGEPAVIPVDEIVTLTTLVTEPTREESLSIQYTIPVEMRVTMEPQEETGHLVHVAVTVFDNSGQPVPNLGLVNPWMCDATLSYQRNENAPHLEGETSVPFVGGVAEFTRLRVDSPSQFLTLNFRTNPRRFDVQTSVQFEVVGPPESTQRERVMFVLAGNVGALPGNEVEIKEAVRAALGRQLDVDVSRLQDIAITISGSAITVEVDLLERHPTDPPNVPPLNETITQLQTLVKSQQLVVTIDGDSFVAVSSSFGYPTSPSPTSPTSPSPVPTNYTTIITVVCSSVGGVLAVVAVWISAYFCTRLCRKNKGKKGSREEKMWKGKAGTTRTKVEKIPATALPLRLMVENPTAEDSDTSSDESDIYLERTTPFHAAAKFPSPTPPHVLTPAESFFDSGQETQRTSLDTMGVEMPQGIFTNQYADCWSDTLPPLHHEHKPTVTLGGLANPSFGLQPPAWSPPPPPTTSVPPDWRKPGPRAHKMPGKRQ